MIPFLIDSDNLVMGRNVFSKRLRFQLHKETSLRKCEPRCSTDLCFAQGLSELEGPRILGLKTCVISMSVVVECVLFFQSN